ncbi:MAG: hypothetical protein ABI640_17845 [Gammaproteobacteria bacterium]
MLAALLTGLTKIKEHVRRAVDATARHIRIANHPQQALILQRAI